MSICKSIAKKKLQPRYGITLQMHTLVHTLCEKLLYILFCWILIIIFKFGVIFPNYRIPLLLDLVFVFLFLKFKYVKLEGSFGVSKWRISTRVGAWVFFVTIAGSTSSTIGPYTTTRVSTRRSQAFSTTKTTLCRETMAWESLTWCLGLGDLVASWMYWAK